MGLSNQAPEAVVREIHRQIPRKFAAERKTRIVPGDDSLHILNGKHSTGMATDSDSETI